MTEFDKIVLVDTSPGTPLANKEILSPTMLPECGDRIKFGASNIWPKVMYRHFDYDAKIIYLMMR